MSTSRPVGLYLSVPFCKAKCSFCNFASDAFAPSRMEAYVERLCGEIRKAKATANGIGSTLSDEADSVYFGGGTPSLLSASQFRQIFAALRETFDLADDAEVTLECAPGQLEDDTLEELLRQGMNRVSLGVQSFVDRESAAVGRLHTGMDCEREIARLRSAGVREIGLDLIAGLPHQTELSWRESLERTITSGVTHVSVYMLEVDDESRLGREVITGGERYGARSVPLEDDVAAWYETGCELLDAAGVRQYEISNFAREGFESHHNMKYWRREPYMGFGLDAHSMLPVQNDEGSSVRFQNTDDLDVYMVTDSLANEISGPLAILPRAKDAQEVVFVGADGAFEESLFLGLRMNKGIDLAVLKRTFGSGQVQSVMPSLIEVCEAGLLTIDEDQIRLTARGRMASNEVFSRLLVQPVA